MSRELQYPHFLECTEFTEDEFWKNLFEDLSFAETPNGCFISKGHLQSTIKGREFIYKIKADDDPFIVYSTLTDIFTKKLKISSPTDVELSKVGLSSEECETWTSIKKKTIKDIIITNFVIDMSKQYNISVKKTKVLMDMITLFMSLKIISNTDIEYSNGKILSIIGLSYSPTLNTFKYDKSFEIDNVNMEINDDTSDMGLEWKKLIINLDKAGDY